MSDGLGWTAEGYDPVWLEQTMLDARGLPVWSEALAVMLGCDECGQLICGCAPAADINPDITFTARSTILWEGGGVCPRRSSR